MIIKEKNSELSILYILIAILGLIYLTHALYFPGLFLEGDGLRHYQISRYSWKYPIQFLNLWGKPFFTLVSSPFSQFGIMGIKIFNIICALLSCICVFHIAKKLEIKRPLLAPLFLGFTNIYFFMAISGFTELLFGLMVVFCIYSYLNEKYLLSTFLISFLPYVRSEGYLLLPLFFIILVLRKQYLIALLLSAGTFIYSVLGYFAYNDLFWIHSQNPYQPRSALIYGHGPLLHFVRAYYFIWGTPLAILTLIGLLYSAVIIFRNKNSDNKYFKEKVFLVYGSLVVYFCAHSIFWWKGIFNSLGLERVMGAVLPVSALVSLDGFNFILSFFTKQKILSNVIAAIIVASILIKPFHNDYFPLKPYPEVQLVYEVKKWYENSELKKHDFKKFFLHPNLPEALSFDPFDVKNCFELWGFYSAIDKWGYDVVPDSSLIFWDAHYGPNEANVPLDRILADTNFRLIKSFFPKEPFFVLGNQPFAIHVFQKLKREKNINNIIDEVKYDFETNDGLDNINTITIEQAFSGIKSSLLNATNEYSALILKNTEELKNIENIHCIKLNFKVYGSGEIESRGVLSFHKDGKQIVYQDFPIIHNFLKKGEWADLECHWLVDPSEIKKADFIKLYVWNYKKQTFYIDDFDLKYLNLCY